MKKLFTLIITCIATIASAQTYIDTTGGRYWDPIFSTVTITSNVNYGSNVTISGATQTLDMDIYEPAGDTVQMRPLLVLAHGGSFIFGSKTDQDVVTLCTRFAKMGYVCASINYRLGMGFPIDTVRAGKAVVRAVQDMKAAIRYFRMDAAATNSYHIHPDYIFAGGSSAGAFTALHLAYMDSAEVPAYFNVASMGGIEGTSGNPGYPSNVLGVINLCGALGDSAWINAGDIPFVSMHGTADATVPYGSAVISVLTVPLLVVDGSASLKLRADNAGVSNPFHTWYGAPHVPYAGTNATQMAYMDSTVDFVKTFLRPFFGIPINAAVNSIDINNLLSLYPNPAHDKLNINLNNQHLKVNTIQIYTAEGKMVKQFPGNRILNSINISSLDKGMYIIKIIIDDKVAIQKLIVD